MPIYKFTYWRYQEVEGTLDAKSDMDAIRIAEDSIVKLNQAAYDRRADETFFLVSVSTEIEIPEIDEPFILEVYSGLNQDEADFDLLNN